MKYTLQEIQFIRDNHTLMMPKDLAIQLGKTQQSVSVKMARLGIKTASMIKRENRANEMQILLSQSTPASEIARITGLHLQFINDYIFNTAILKQQQIKRAYKPEHQPTHYDDIRKLDDAGLSDFKVNDQYEYTRYHELSPSEKVMYHEL